MSNYNIQPHTFLMAKRLGVKVRPSNNPKKKIDVLGWNGHFICSVGDIDYGDYSTYLIKAGEHCANERRRLYHIRHRKDGDMIGSKGYYAKYLLW